MKLTEKQKNCPYCHDGWFEGKTGWQHANVKFLINKKGAIEVMINGTYGYVDGIRYCPICGRDLRSED